jgi:hypothetical protein
MSCKTHEGHEHKHGKACGHKTIQHNDHTDYVHDNHLHHVHDDHVDEHVLAEDAKNKSECTPSHSCAGHEASHEHGPSCGHDAVPHGDHMDYLVNGHLHRPCGNHCDDHGAVMVA